MAVLNLSNPIFHMDDPATGGPLVGGLVYTYVAGTSTELTTYSDSGLNNANTNPVVLNAYGDAPIWFDQDMKVIVRSADGLTTYYTFDNISPAGGTTTVTGNYNLCLNGSFESGTGSDVSNWTLTPYSGATIEIDTTNVSHGLQALKFDGLTGVGGGSAVSGKFNVSASSVLYISLDTMASHATTTNDVQIFWFQKDDSTPSATASTTLTLPAEGDYPTSMTSYRFFVTVPSDATRAYIKLIGIDSGGSNLDQDCWFDNVFVLDQYARTGTYIDHTAASISNSLTLTEMFSYTIPANTMKANTTARLTLHGTFLNNSGSNRTFNTRIRLGSTTLVSSGSSFGGVTFSTSASERSVKIVVEINFISTSSQVATIYGMVGDPAADSSWAIFGGGTNGAVAIARYTTGAEDATTDLLLDFFVQNSFAASTITYTHNSATLEFIE